MKRTSTRRVGFSIGVVGVLAVLGGVFLPDARTVLFALGGTGIYTGLLVPYLAAEATVPASVATGIYNALLEDVAALGDDRDLDAIGIYAPSGPGSGSSSDGRSASLLLARQADSAMVERGDVGSLFVTASERGVVLSPIGGPLVEEFERSLPGGLASEPDELLTQLLDGLTKQFELVDHATMAVDREASRARIDVPRGVCGPVDRFDHPIVSFLGVGLAMGLRRAVSVEVSATDTEQATYRVICTWAE